MIYDMALSAQLEKLAKDLHIKGIKAEFEAEGSAFRDIVRLRHLTAQHRVPLHVKIGGVEAIRDIKDCYELQVDGVIAPMVESAFGAHKFVTGLQKIYRENLPKLHATLNVETKGGIAQLDEILKVSEGVISNITIGRTDLSGSYFDSEVTPDSNFICGVLEGVVDLLKKTKMTLTVGGSLSENTRQVMVKRPQLVAAITCFETRNVMMPARLFVDDADAIQKALKFEELYILSKKDLSDLMMEAEVNRLTQLRRRS
jgi:4-hydroxy-2-oxoheptanedioate aldolase